MSKLLKIILTPAMAILVVLIVSVGWIYYNVLVKLYDYAWGQTNDI